MGGLDGDALCTAQGALRQLEREEDCTVVAAHATGARARGTDHYHSDVDVFAIVVQDPAVTAVGHDEIGKEFTVFDRLTPGVDVQFWSVRETYEALAEANPSAINGIRSTAQIEINCDADSWLQLKTLVEQGTNTYRLLHHFRSMAKQNYQKYFENGNDETFGRAFQVLDALLRAAYVEVSGDLPPFGAHDLRQWGLGHGYKNDSESPVDEFVRATIESYGALKYLKSSGRGANPYMGVGDIQKELMAKATFTELVGRELDRSPPAYDEDHYGANISNSTLAAILNEICEQAWEA